MWGGMLRPRRMSGPVQAVTTLWSCPPARLHATACSSCMDHASFPGTTGRRSSFSFRETQFTKTLPDFLSVVTRRRAWRVPVLIGR